MACRPQRQPRPCRIILNRSRFEYPIFPPFFHSSLFPSSPPFFFLQLYHFLLCLASIIIKRITNRKLLAVNTPAQPVGWETPTEADWSRELFEMHIVLICTESYLSLNFGSR